MNCQVDKMTSQLNGKLAKGQAEKWQVGEKIK